MCGFSSTWQASVVFAEKACSRLRSEETQTGVLPSGKTKHIAKGALIQNFQLAHFVYTRLVMKQQSVLIAAVK